MNLEIRFYNREIEISFQKYIKKMLDIKTPLCTMCDVKFQSMELLSVHMAKIHQESDHCRILRLAKTFESVRYKESMEVNSVQKLKDFSCVECGEFFETIKMQKNHNDKKHQCKIIQQKVLVVDSDSEEEPE